MKALALSLIAAFALLATTAVAFGAKPVPTGTIALDQAGVSLGDWVTFTTTTSGLNGSALPRIQILCYQDVNGSGIISRTEDLDANGFVDDLVYGEVRNAVNDGGLYGQPFLLGGGSSDWRTRGGAAECDTTLYYWGNQGQFNVLATLSFNAGG